MLKTTKAYVKILEMIVEPTSRYERKDKEVRICAKDDSVKEKWDILEIYEGFNTDEMT